MQTTSSAFKENARAALADAALQEALSKLKTGFTERRTAAAKRMPEFEDLRDKARDLKNHVLEHLDYYLEVFEQRVSENGGEVHWCCTPEDARQAILTICRAAGAKVVTKGKSMIGEEIGLNEFLESQGITPVETDLGEYIIQLRGEPPSHLIAPAIHVNKDQVADTFRKAHTDLAPERSLQDPRSLLSEARLKLRDKFFAAEVGITGANFLIAET